MCSFSTEFAYSESFFFRIIFSTSYLSKTWVQHQIFSGHKNKLVQRIVLCLLKRIFESTLLIPGLRYIKLVMLPGGVEQKHGYGYVASVIASYWVVSISMVYLNKILLSNEEASISAPLFVTWYQVIFTFKYTRNWIFSST